MIIVNAPRLSWRNMGFLESYFHHIFCYYVTEIPPHFQCFFFHLMKGGVNVLFHLGLITKTI